VTVQGANGLDVVFKRFTLTDGEPLPGCPRQPTLPHPTPPEPQPSDLLEAGEEAASTSTAHSVPPECAADRPLHVELEVSVSNPSSFEFQPLGALELVVQDQDLVTFATCRTADAVWLPRGDSTILLRGSIAVAPGTEPQFSAALTSYLAGHRTRLSATFSHLSNQLYHSALAGLTVPAILPGLPDARLFRSVGLILDPGWNMIQLALGTELNDGARLHVQNPLNLTVSVLGLSAVVEYGDELIARVQMSVIDPPIVMAPLWAGTPDLVFPVKLSAPMPTLETLLAQLALGGVEVGLVANITVRVGNTTNIVGYAQDRVRVFLG
jgi:hypothetical protein